MTAVNSHSSYEKEAEKCFGGLSCEINTKHMELLIIITDSNGSSTRNGYTLPFRGWIHGKARFHPSFEYFVIDRVPPSKETTAEILNNASILLQLLNFNYCCL